MSTTPGTTETALPAHLNPANFPQTVHIDDQNIHIELTYSPLNPSTHLAHIRRPNAGANVLFLGTTRDTFDDKPVARLSYTSYAPMALRTLTSIARDAVQAHNLTGISIAHRLGDVPVEEESIAIAVSSGHRGAAWRAGEEVLEEIKKRAEIWKMEEFVGEPKGEGVWKANKDTDPEGNVIGKANP